MALSLNSSGSQQKHPLFLTGQIPGSWQSSPNEKKAGSPVGHDRHGVMSQAIHMLSAAHIEHTTVDDVIRNRNVLQPGSVGNPLLSAQDPS